MAITATNLTGNTNATTLQSYDTASISPGANKLILASVNIRNYNAVDLGTISLSGNGLTWVEVDTRIYSTLADSKSRLSIFRAMGASPTSGVVTITISGTSNAHCSWSVEEYDGIDTSGTNGSGAIVQTAFDITDNNSGDPLAVTLAALTGNNAVHASFGYDDGGAIVAGTGYTQLTSVGSGSNFLLTEYKVPGTTTPTESGSPSFTDAAGIGVEIKEASAGGGVVIPVFMKHYKGLRV